MLTSILDAHGTQLVELLQRELCVEGSTSPAEVVTCQTTDDAELRLFCKYSRRGRRNPSWHTAHGHRGGVTYEAQVYERVLAPLRLSTPRCFGVEQTRDQTWLILAYLDDALRLKSEPDAMVAAAAWFGGFHAIGERLVGATGAGAFLRLYDAAYYEGWAERTFRHAGRRRRTLPWLGQLEDRVAEIILELVRSAQTVIHGECYPSNVLVREGRIHPVDWETAAIGAGEIDLVCLTEHWGETIVDRAIAAYVAARFPSGAPARFQRILWAARIYVLFRWMGERGVWSSEEAAGHYLARLHHAVERFDRS